MRLISTIWIKYSCLKHLTNYTDQEKNKKIVEDFGTQVFDESHGTLKYLALFSRKRQT